MVEERVLSNLHFNKHFEPKYVKAATNNGRCRLVKSLKPVPTILNPDSGDSPEVARMKAPVFVPRKSPRKRSSQKDDQTYQEIDDKLTPSGYSLTRYDQHIVFFRKSRSMIHPFLRSRSAFGSIMICISSCFIRMAHPFRPCPFHYQIGFLKKEGTASLRGRSCCRTFKIT